MNREDHVGGSRSLRQQHRAAAHMSAAVVRAVQPHDLGLSTPCRAWDLRELIGHMVGLNFGFADAAGRAAGHVALGGDSTAPWRHREVGDDPWQAYKPSVTRVLDAFDDPVLDGLHLQLPVVAGGVEVPSQTALRFHLLDLVVHSWDVSIAGGRPVPDIDEDVLETARATAESVPETSRASDDTAAFGPRLEATASSDRWTTLLALAGRRP